MIMFALRFVCAIMIATAAGSFVGRPWPQSANGLVQEHERRLDTLAQAVRSPESPGHGRRHWLVHSAQKSGLVLSTLLLTAPTFGVQAQAARASVYVDPDRYGDKELKIAIVNRVRQNVRDVIVAQPSLAPDFLEIAIQDAISYNAKTQRGGPDGSMLRYILSTKSGQPLYELKPAVQDLEAVRCAIQRSTEITAGDIIALAAAEAIETLGGPRIVVQLGKLEPSNRSIDPDEVPVAGQKKVQAFRRAGLTEREAVLLYATKGAMEQVVASATVARQEEESEPAEENEMGDKDIYIPISFGTKNEVYGKQLGQLDSSFLLETVDQLKKEASPSLWSDEVMAGWAMKYAKSGFIKDLPEAYGRLTRLGTVYTGGRSGSLTGIGETSL